MPYDTEKDSPELVTRKLWEIAEELSRMAAKGVSEVHSGGWVEGMQDAKRIVESAAEKRDPILVKAREIAARVWCDPEMGAVAMNMGVCETIARIVERMLRDTGEEKHAKPHRLPHDSMPYPQ